MNIFKNHVILRGFLSKDAEVPTSNHIQPDSYAVLTLSVESGVWNKAASKWIPQTTRHTILCPGPYFCGFTRGMKHGDYVEVEGELRSTLVEEGTTLRNSLHAYVVHALTIRRLEVPAIGVDEGAAEET
ncbi:MAG: hypothetical protein ACYCO5_04800 [Acidobacteriaceae bacterium]